LQDWAENRERGMAKGWPPFAWGAGAQPPLIYLSLPSSSLDPFDILVT